MNAHDPGRPAAIDPSARLAPCADEPWWTLSAGAARTALLDADGRPVPLGVAREDLVAALRARVGGFTPDWTGSGPDDAGDALLRLFALMAEAVAARVDRLPAKLLVEHLRIAGVSPLPASPAQVLLRLTATAAAGPGVQVPAGFQAGAPGEDGTEVVLETVDDMWVSPAELAFLAVGRPATGALPGPVDEVTPGQGPAAEGFLPFGAQGIAGSALWLGFTAPQDLEGGLSLAFVAAPRPGGPAAAARGAVAPPGAPPPELHWSVLDGDTFRPVYVLVDHTGALSGTGTVQLRLPAGWRPGHPPGGAQLPEARWLRVRLTGGSYAEPPRLVAALPHTVLASAVRTVRDEVLSPVPLEPRELEGGTGVRLRVATPPVVPGSLTVTVADDPAAPLFPDAAPSPLAQGPVPVWREVTDLALAGPADRVFALDAETGVLIFGDGVHGVALPPGVGNVRAVSYHTGGGRQGAVAADAATVLRTAVPGVAAVSNPLPGTGGSDTELFGATVRRGAAEIRTAGRAVTPADHALLAMRAPGARIARAHAVPGHHPDHPGARLPGIVGVYLVPPDEDPATTGAPLPTAGDLEAVTDHLTHTLAPTGITVVAAAPRYVRVDARIELALEAGADRAAAVRRAEGELRRFLHPLGGGPAGDGWPFGGPLVHTTLLRRLLTDGAVTAVPLLTLTVDGLPVRPCADTPLPPHALIRVGRVTASVVADTTAQKGR
ncbi:putative baseplate assembly protein [Streptomyces sp. NBC_01381]|uniref:putative baseplate assembly protein n=1 Tax=Streptomyces sp. NBC_01381 TaxID=2903845 RepID=UPI00225A9BBA|nr:putative baseplate assembly protein [Streptomyces sp. NBC_01381]MCX4673184.1 putative baseplate assembly protein [Streptomyces sp. NBC_01381]